MGQPEQEHSQTPEAAPRPAPPSDGLLHEYLVHRVDAGETSFNLGGIDWWKGDAYILPADQVGQYQGDARFNVTTLPVRREG